MWYRSRAIEKCLLCCYAGASESCTIKFTKVHLRLHTANRSPQSTTPGECNPLCALTSGETSLSFGKLRLAPSIPLIANSLFLWSRALKGVSTGNHPITRHSKHYATCDLEYNYSNFRVPICPSITLYFNSLYQGKSNGRQLSKHFFDLVFGI